MRASRRLLLLVGVAGVIAVTAAAAFAATVSWGKAVAVRGAVNSISCASAGNCVAGGFNGKGAFVKVERAGVWRKVMNLRGTAGGSVSSVSCRASYCAAGGYFADASALGGDQAFVVSERNGVWGKAIAVPGTPGGSVTSVSCGGAGNCSAVGLINSADIYGEPQPFLVTEKNGVWGHAKAADVYAVSCVSAGYCVAGGGFYDTAHDVSYATFLTETNGIWRKEVKVPAPGAVTSVSCVSISSCAAGTFGFVMSETLGVWHEPVAAPPGEIYFSVSCGSPGNCTAGGDRSTEFGGDSRAFLMSSTSGVWGKPMDVTGVMTGDFNATFVSSVSCAGAGTCAAVGGYLYSGSGHLQFAVAEKNGVWGQAKTVPGIAYVVSSDSSGGGAIACVKTGRCALGGGGFVTTP
jgi:hypothetical protein